MKIQMGVVMLSRIYLYISVFSQFLFYLPGTFLHEAAHWLVAKLTFSHVPSKAIIEEEDEDGNKIKRVISGFTIIPKIKKDQVVYGHVLSIPKAKAAFVFISSAPLIWFVVLYFLLTHYGYLTFLTEDGEAYFKINYLEFFRLENWLLIYVSLQLIWAGTLSSQDIKMFLKGIFSISFLTIIAFTTIICQLKCQEIFKSFSLGVFQ